MAYESDVAKRYREHAEELRTIAGTDRDHKIRSQLLRIATDYDRMAASMDVLGRSAGGITPAG